MSKAKEALSKFESRDAYIEGFKAGTKVAKTNEPIKNPNSKNSKEYNEWKKGFNEAFDQARSKMESAKNKNSTSEEVYMFEKGNKYRYLVGYFDRKSGESDKDFLDRVAKSEEIPASNRSNLTLE